MQTCDCMCTRGLRTSAWADQSAAQRNAIAADTVPLIRALIPSKVMNEGLHNFSQLVSTLEAVPLPQHLKWLKSVAHGSDQPARIAMASLCMGVWIASEAYGLTGEACNMEMKWCLCAGMVMYTCTSMRMFPRHAWGWSHLEFVDCTYKGYVWRA